MRYAALSLLALLCACDPENRPAPDTPGETGTGSLTFVLVNTGPDTIWVQERTEIDPVAWLSLRQGDTPLAFEPRCDVRVCGEPPAICGAMIPLVRAVAPNDSVLHRWDGRYVQRVINPTDGETPCQQRLKVGPGAFVAQVCYSDAVGPPAGPGGCEVRAPRCVEHAFTRPTDRVKIPVGRPHPGP